MIEIALFQPDIAPNAATIIRLATCFGLKVTIIEPAGFVWSDSSFRRAGMDYLDRAAVARAASWDSFLQEKAAHRLVLLTTKAAQPLHHFSFQSNDIILMGREGSGVPAEVHATLSHRIRIPMQNGERSLNVSLACAIATAEALRQTSAFDNLA